MIYSNNVSILYHTYTIEVNKKVREFHGIFIGKLISKELSGASINSESQFFHFADSTQNNAESLSTDPMLRLFCRGSC